MFLNDKYTISVRYLEDADKKLDNIYFSVYLILQFMKILCMLTHLAHVNQRVFAWHCWEAKVFMGMSLWNFMKMRCMTTHRNLVYCDDVFRLFIFLKMSVTNPMQVSILCTLDNNRWHEKVFSTYNNERVVLLQSFGHFLSSSIIDGGRRLVC